MLGWNRDGNFPSFECLKRGLTVRRFMMNCPSNRIYYRIVPTLLFSFWALKTLLVSRPKITYACDVDAAIPCFFYKLITGNSFVLDVFDRFSFAIPKRVASTILRSLEEFFASKADLFITNSMMLFNTFVCKPANSEIIMNCPNDKNPDHPEKSFSPFFRIVYAGYIMSTRGLELLAKVVSNFEKVKLIIVGKPSSYKYLKTITSYKNVFYLGILSYDRAIELQSTADLIVIPYDPNVLMNSIGVPNKLFDAMMLGVPVVATIGKDIIEETSCGIFVRFDLDSMRSAIRYLKDNPNIRYKLGMNGRKAFEAKYNWNFMEEKLMSAFKRLFVRAQLKRARSKGLRNCDV